MQTVLIVDDEKLFLSSVSEGLADELDGILVLTASNGEEALAVFKQTTVDLLVTDLKMPGIDGFQLLAAVVSAWPGVSAVVMTAFGTAEIERNVRKLGAIGYLEKPIDLQLLADTIQEVLFRRGRGFVQGINLQSFLQLLGLNRKSCTLNLRRGSRTGQFIFCDGELVNARAGTLTGDEAALEILGWEQPEVEFWDFVKKESRTVNTSLDLLLIEAFSALDEHAWVQDLLQEHHPIHTSQDAFQPIPAGTAAGDSSKEILAMANVKDSLSAVMEIEGTVGAALADWKSGMCLGTIGGTPTYNLEIAAAGNTEVVRAKMKAMANLGIRETIEDILITLDTQFHLIRLIKSAPNLFLYVAIKKDTGNLALARHKLSAIEGQLQI